MSLLVRTEFLVGRSVQVNGQIWNPHDRSVDMDESVLQFAVSGLDQHAAGDLQVPIEPRVPNAATVTLNAHLEEERGGWGVREKTGRR